MIPAQVGKYDIRGELGAGAMGVVLDGFDPDIQRRAAIKLMPLPRDADASGAEALERFRREAQAAGRLNHPGIVAVYDYGKNQDHAWIAMELVEGGSLKQRLDRGERLPLPEITRIMREVLDALAYSHQHGVVHRDIKPANIMLTRDGRVKLADFGIARIEDSGMTQVGTIIGTPAYMSPEQMRGETVDSRADIWAAGVVLYQLLTGEKPFDGGYSAVQHKALHTEPPPPSALAVTAPRALDAVVARAMAKRPEDRWPSAATFAEAMLAAASAPAEATLPMPAELADATVVARRPAATPAAAPAATVPPAAKPAASTSPPRQGLPWLVILPAGVVALLLLAGGGWFMLDQQRSAPPRPAPPPAALATTEGSSQPPATITSPTLTPVAEAPASAAPVITPPEPPAPEPLAAGQPAAGQPAAEPPAAGGGAPPAKTSAAPLGKVPVTPASPLPGPAPMPANEAAPSPASPPPPATSPAPQPDFRAAAAAAASAPACGLVAGSADDHSLSLRGVLARGQQEAVQQVLAQRGIPADAARIALQEFAGPYCPALDLLRPLLALPEAPPQLHLLGIAPLRTDQLLRFEVTLPQWDGYLQVFYLMSSGEAGTLVPATRQSAGHKIVFGDPRPGFPGWAVSAPFGTDLLVVIYSAVPVFRTPRPVLEQQDSFRAALSAALAEHQRAGVRMVLRPLVVETRP